MKDIEAYLLGRQLYRAADLAAMVEWTVDEELEWERLERSLGEHGIMVENPPAPVTEDSTP